MSEEKIYSVNWEKVIFALTHYTNGQELSLKDAIIQLNDVFNIYIYQFLAKLCFGEIKARDGVTETQLLCNYLLAKLNSTNTQEQEVIIPTKADNNAKRSTKKQNNSMCTLETNIIAYTKKAVLLRDGDLEGWVAISQIKNSINPTDKKQTQTFIFPFWIREKNFKVPEEA